MTTTVNLQISLETLVEAIHSLDLQSKHRLLEILEQQIFEAEEADYKDDEPSKAEIDAIQAECDRGEYVTLNDHTAEPASIGLY